MERRAGGGPDEAGAPAVLEEATVYTDRVIEVREKTLGGSMSGDGLELGTGGAGGFLVTSGRAD